MIQTLLSMGVQAIPLLRVWTFVHRRYRVNFVVMAECRRKPFAAPHGLRRLALVMPWRGKSESVIVLSRRR